MEPISPEQDLRFCAACGGGVAAANKFCPRCGQQLAAPATLTRVGVVNGYSKRDPVTAVDRYRQERRILSVTWQFSNGTALTQQLRDGDHGMQTLAVPNITADKVTLHIDTTTAPGDARFDYTAISELNITGG